MNGTAGSGGRLSGFERCGRIPFWGAKWKPRKLKPVEMIETGVRAGLTEHIRSDYGELAGEEVYGLGSDPGIDSKQYDQHSEVVHLACHADVITSAVRPVSAPPWKPAPPLPNWTSSCFLSPDSSRLRRIVFVTNWNDDRHYSLCRSWESLGEVCHYDLPMQMVVVILGQHRDGRYHSYWSHGLLHPGNKKLRFRKRNDVAVPFKGSWIEIWRENYDNISTHDWLQAMLDDGVLQDCCMNVEIPVPKPEQRQRIVDLAQRKLDIIHNTKTLPDQCLSVCDWPTPCVFRVPCHALEEPEPIYGFVRVNEVGSYRLTTGPNTSHPRIPTSIHSTRKAPALRNQSG